MRLLSGELWECSFCRGDLNDRLGQEEGKNSLGMVYLIQVSNGKERGKC